MRARFSPLELPGHQFDNSRANATVRLLLLEMGS
jgi:hypothetical protein